MHKTWDVTDYELFDEAKLRRIKKCIKLHAQEKRFKENNCQILTHD